MLKKGLMVALSVVLLVSGVPLSAQAEKAGEPAQTEASVNEVVVKDEFGENVSVEEVTKENFWGELTQEEITELKAWNSEEREAFPKGETKEMDEHFRKAVVDEENAGGAEQQEESFANAEGIPGIEVLEEEVIYTEGTTEMQPWPADVEIVSLEDSMDIQGVEGITYNVTCDAPTNNYIYCNVVITGYSYISDYNNNALDIYVFEDGDSLNFAKMKKSMSYGTVNGVYTITVRAAFNGDPNTTYSVRPMYYDSATGKNVAAVDPISVTTGAQREIQYSMTCENPEGSILDLNMEARGFKDSYDFSLTGSSLRFMVSTSESFETYDVVYDNYYGSTSGGEYVRYADGSYLGEGNTTYYIKPVIYDSATSSYITVGETKTIITGEKTVFEADYSLMSYGTSYASFMVNMKGASEDVLEKYVVLQYSEDEDFEDYNWSNIYCDKENEDGSFEGDVKISGLDGETTHYFRIALKATVNNQYVYTPLTDVMKVTTLENVEYEDNCFPDEVFRNYLKGRVGIEETEKLDKAHLEKLTWLDCDRSDPTEPVVKDLTGIELMPWITSVEMDYNELTDISILAKLPLLYEINVRGNRLKTLPDVSGLTLLETFYVNYNYIPENEFVESKLPTHFLAEEGDWWLEEMIECQRATGGIGIITADTYYSVAKNQYPIQVEITNTNPIDVYTLDIYEGDTLLRENLEVMNYWTDYGTADFVVNDITDVMGAKPLTFVVKANGTETARVTRTIEFKEQIVYHPYIGMYMEAGSDEQNVQCYSLGATSKITKFEVLDEEGNVLYTKNSPSGYLNDNTDYRYEGLFKECCIEIEYAYCYFNMYPEIPLSVGKYDVRLTLEDESIVLGEDAFIVTEHSVVSELEVLDYDYQGSADGENIYIGVAGLNLDWDRLGPVVYNKAGGVVSRVVDYMIVSENAAIYKVRNNSNKSWKEAVSVGIWHQPADIFINEKVVEFYLYFEPEIEYAEHMMDAGKVFVLCSNMEDNVEYTWELYKYNKASEGAVATCTAALKDGMAELQFKNADGSNFEFDPDQAKYTVDCTSIITVSYSFTNEKRGSLYTPNYSKISNENSPYVNAGQVFVQTHRLNASVLNKDAELKVVLHDDDGNVVEHQGSVTKELTYYQQAAGAEKIWEITVTLDGVEWVSDADYWYEVLAGETVLGQSSIYVLDPQKLYYTAKYADYVENDKVMELCVEGCFPEELDTELFGIDIYDAANTQIIYQGKAVSVIRTGENQGTANEEIRLTYDLSSAVELVEADDLFRYCFTYDGQQIENLRLSASKLSVYIDDEPEIDFRYENGDYNNYTITGIYRENMQAVKVLFYPYYDTTPIVTIDVPEGGNCLYEFTAEELQPLLINKYDRVYYVIILDSDGNYLYSDWDYVGGMWPFTDVKADRSNWQYAGINYAYGAGIMTGKSTYTFAPNEQITRDMFVQILYSLEGKPAVEYKTTFTDVAEGQWFTNAVTWAAENGITSGYADGRFGVNDPISREQLAVMLYKYAQLKQYDVTKEAAIDSYVDGNAVTSWAQTATKWAVGNGIISGKNTASVMRLDPQGNATRAECAAMMRKFCYGYVE